MQSAGRCLIALLLAVGLGPSPTDRAGGQADADRARELSQRAAALEAEGSDAAALSLLWEAAELAPGDADLQNRLGEALERAGATEAAVEAYRRAVRAQPTLTRATNNLVLALAAIGEGAEALRLARAAVAEAPRDPDRLYTLGLALAERDLAGAIDTFRRVLALEPGHLLARYNLARAFQRADRAAEAIAELDAVIDAEPRPEALYTLGVIHWQQGDLTRAADRLEDAIRREPRYFDAHYTLGAVRQARGDAPGAVDALRRAAELRPDDAGAHYALAQALGRAGERAEAAAHAAESERLRRRARQEHEASILTYMGIRKLEAGEPLDALDHFRRATTVREAHAPAHYHMGRALERLGEPEASRAAFTRARQLDPGLVPPPDPR